MVVRKVNKRLSSARAWVLARKISQGIFLFIFILLLVEAPLRGWSFDLINLPLRLDPLAMLASVIAARTLLAGSALALIVIALTIVFGRVWCSWICPLGTTLDLFPIRKKRAKISPPMDKWRSVKYSLLISILVAALFSNLTLLNLDPLTIFVRSFSASLWPSLDHAVTAIETVLYNIPFLQALITHFDAFIRPTLFPINPAFYQFSFLFTAIFIGLIFLNWFAPRFWCRYLCPLGAMMGIISKISIYKFTVTGESG